MVAEQRFSTGYFKPLWLLVWLLEEEDGGDGQGSRQQLTWLLLDRNHLPDGLLALLYVSPENIPVKHVWLLFIQAVCLPSEDKWFLGS